MTYRRTLTKADCPCTLAYIGTDEKRDMNVYECIRPGGCRRVSKVKRGGRIDRRRRGY